MPADMTVQRALKRSRCVMLFLAMSVLVAPWPSHAQSNANSAQAQVNGLTAEPTVAQVLDEAALAGLEAEIGGAFEEDENVRPLMTEAPLSPLQTALLVLAGLGLLALAGVVLTLALRDLRKDKELRRRTYRRRAKRRSVPDTTATA